ncbi:MAG TPA: DUF1844 domain-containing protein [Terriglobales bacterium]|nr:DUF1844 domain-containing protein [Terriglobales bacterium]
MPNKEPEFTVTDRRKFTIEGEARTDAPVEAEKETREEQSAPAASSAASEAAPAPSVAPPSPAGDASPDRPTAPSSEEQARQRTEYRDSAKSIEDELRKGYGSQAVPDYEASFDRLLEPFYLTALMQLGMMPAERGAQPQVDIIGARHTIDTLALLQEKTKGNLTGEEANVLETVIYQLRMRYIELTNAIARSAHTKEGEPGGPGIK